MRMMHHECTCMDNSGGTESRDVDLHVSWTRAGSRNQVILLHLHTVASPLESF